MTASPDKSVPAILRELLRQPRPEVLNFQVNDICNARCLMCNIWRNRQGTELSPEEFAALLRAPFFHGVRHVGITGGEPTLRSDLAQFYHALPAVLPQLQGASFITNGFKSVEAVAALGEVHLAYAALGKHFSGMVSIDGVGEVHDRVRGRPGSWTKATATLFGLRDAGVDVHAACTIVRANVWAVEELLEWGVAQRVYLRFRVGEYIRRLYNLDVKDQIRAFDAAEIKHLVSFFQHLLLAYEREPRIQRTYRSIVSVLTGGPRLTTCPYQTSAALNVDSRGLFAVCAPCGEPLPLTAQPERATRRLRERLRIRREKCPQCIHDYHGEFTRREHDRQVAAGLAAGRLTATPAPATPRFDATDRPLSRILIAGWYGTETAGDIAILGGILGQYRDRGARRFTVLSLYPEYSRTTLPPLATELDVALEIRAYDDPAVLSRLTQFDVVVMGGGPLMDISPTETVRNLFRAARTQGVDCHVHGCGLGPLHQPHFQSVVAEILALAGEIRVRDEGSRRAALALRPGLNVAVIADPSREFLRRQNQPWRGGERVIRCWLRMLTHEYRQETSPETATSRLIEFLRRLLAWYPEYTLELGAMHWFPVGWDDRVYARALARELPADRVAVDRRPRTPSEILARMAAADLNVCMRFHSVVFAHAIGAPLVALDYTAGGKIAHFLAEAGAGGRELRYPDLPALTAPALRARILGPASHLRA